MKKLNPRHKSLVLYFDQKPMFEVLTDEEAGQLIKLILNMDVEPNPLINNGALKVAFAQIQNKIFENDQEWTQKAEKAAAAANTRWIKENEKKFTNGEIGEQEFFETRDRLEDKMSDKLIN